MYYGQCMTIEEQAQSLRDFETAVLFVSAQRSLEEQKRGLEEKNRELELQLLWFKKQLFGERSEKRAGAGDPHQLSLGELLPPAPPCSRGPAPRRNG